MHTCKHKCNICPHYKLIKYNKSLICDLLRTALNYIANDDKKNGLNYTQTALNFIKNNAVCTIPK
jgi:hypothetical protein